MKYYLLTITSLHVHMTNDKSDEEILIALLWLMHFRRATVVQVILLSYANITIFWIVNNRTSGAKRPLRYSTLSFVSPSFMLVIYRRVVGSQELVRSGHLYAVSQ